MTVSIDTEREGFFAGEVTHSTINVTFFLTVYLVIQMRCITSFIHVIVSWSPPGHGESRIIATWKLHILHAPVHPLNDLIIHWSVTLNVLPHGHSKTLDLVRVKCNGHLSPSLRVHLASLLSSCVFAILSACFDRSLSLYCWVMDTLIASQLSSS